MNLQQVRFVEQIREAAKSSLAVCQLLEFVDAALYEDCGRIQCSVEDHQKAAEILQAVSIASAMALSDRGLLK